MNHLEYMREELHKTMKYEEEENILKVSREMDKLILDYIKNNYVKHPADTVL